MLLFSIGIPIENKSMLQNFTNFTKFTNMRYSINIRKVDIKLLRGELYI